MRMKVLEYLDISDEEINLKRVAEAQEDLIAAQKLCISLFIDKEFLRQNLDDLREKLKAKEMV